MKEVIPCPAVKKAEVDLLTLRGGRIFNGYLANGKITPGFTTESVDGFFPKGVYYGVALRPSGRLFVCSNQGVYYAPQGEEFLKSDSGFTARKPFAFNPTGEESCVVGDAQCLLTATEISRLKPFNGNIYGGVFKNGRLFGIDRDNAYKLRWSSEGGLEFNESIFGAGWVEITAARGEIMELAVYKQKIIVFCKYGLVALSAFGLPENYKLQYIDGAIDDFFPNSVAVAGGKLLFLTRGGLLSFDGVKLEKLEIPLVSEAQNPVCAYGCGDEYFLSAYDKNLEKNVIFVFDILKHAGYVINSETAAFMPRGSVHCINDKRWFTLVKGGEFTYEAAETDFDSKRYKLLKFIRAEGDGAVDVTVDCDGKLSIFGGVKGVYPLHLRGKRFKITVRGRGEVWALSAVAEVCNGI